MEKLIAILAGLFAAISLSACEMPETGDEGDDSAEEQSTDAEDNDGEDGEGDEDEG